MVTLFCLFLEVLFLNFSVLIGDFRNSHHILLESLSSLNENLPNAVPMTRFRPNIVVENVKVPFDEDSWKTVKVRNITFHGVKPCTYDKTAKRRRETNRNIFSTNRWAMQTNNSRPRKRSIYRRRTTGYPQQSKEIWR